MTSALISGVIVAAIVGHRLLPHGVIVKYQMGFLNGTLTEYERVSGLRGLKHWWKGDLEVEPPASEQISQKPPR